MPSSFSRLRATSSWICPLVRPYWNSARLTSCSDIPRSPARYSVYARMWPAIVSASNGSSCGRPGANEIAAG